jgi:hypothetical protein
MADNVMAFMSTCAQREHNSECASPNRLQSAAAAAQRECFYIFPRNPQMGVP